MKRAVLLSLGILLGCHHRTGQGATQTPAGHTLLTEREVHDANITVEPLEEQTVGSSLSAAATIAYVDTRVAHVMSPVAGRISQIVAPLGAHVEAGSVLATIASPDLGVASSDVDKAQADLIAAQHDDSRKRDLLLHHAASQADVEQADDVLAKAKAEFDRARAKLSLLHGGGQQVTQGYALTTPITGDVIARSVSPGMEVQGGYSGGTPAELFTVADLREVWVFGDVYEVDVENVRLGASVSVHVLAFPDKSFASHIDWVAGALDPATRTLRVRCTLDNSGGLLKPEMFATMSIASTPKRALALPRSAVIRMGDQAVVFVALGAAPDGRLQFERRPVTVDDAENPKWTVLEHGVDKGERVVVSGADALARTL